MPPDKIDFGPDVYEVPEPNNEPVIPQSSKIDFGPDVYEVPEQVNAPSKIDFGTDVYEVPEPNSNIPSIKPYDENQTSVLDQFGSALIRGTKGLGSSFLGAGALAADWIPGKSTDPYLRNPLLEAAKSLEAPGPNDMAAPTWDDVKGFNSGAQYVAQQVGNVIPSVGESLLFSLGAATLGGAEAGPAGAGVGAVAGFFGKEGIKGWLRTKIGRIAAAQAGNSLALSSGEIANDLMGDKNIDEDTARYLATGLGVLAAIPDTFMPTYVASKFLAPAKNAAEKQAKKYFFTELGKETLKVSPVEATTEAYQEWIGIVGRKIAEKRDDPFAITTKDWKQMREAAIGGAFGGAISAPLAAYGEVKNNLSSDFLNKTDDQQLVNVKQTIAQTKKNDPENDTLLNDLTDIAHRLENKIADKSSVAEFNATVQKADKERADAISAEKSAANIKAVGTELAGFRPGVNGMPDPTDRPERQLEIMNLAGSDVSTLPIEQQIAIKGYTASLKDEIARQKAMSTAASDQEKAQQAQIAESQKAATATDKAISKVVATANPTPTAVDMGVTATDAIKSNPATAAAALNNLTNTTLGTPAAAPAAAGAEAPVAAPVREGGVFADIINPPVNDQELAGIAEEIKGKSPEEAIKLLQTKLTELDKRLTPEQKAMGVSMIDQLKKTPAPVAPAAPVAPEKAPLSEQEFGMIANELQGKTPEQSRDIIKNVMATVGDRLTPEQKAYAKKALKGLNDTIAQAQAAQKLPEPVVPVAPSPDIKKSAFDRLKDFGKKLGLTYVEPNVLEPNPLSVVIKDSSYPTFISEDGKVKIAFEANDLYTREGRPGVYLGDPSNVNPNLILISAIITDEKSRGKGLGSKALNEFLSVADEAGVTIKLEPVRMNDFAKKTDKASLSNKGLIEWYKRHGFKEIAKGDNRILVREPRPKAAVPVAAPVSTQEVLPQPTGVNVSPIETVAPTVAPTAELGEQEVAIERFDTKGNYVEDTLTAVNAKKWADEKLDTLTKLLDCLRS